MIVNKVEIRYDKIGTATTINIPLTLQFTPVDNTELIEDRFVKDEIEKSINPIADYKKVRFKPAIIVKDIWKIISKFKFQNVFLINTSSPSLINYTPNEPSTYDVIRFTDVDIFCRYNKLMKSFLLLEFYDTPFPQTNNLLAITSIHTQIGNDQKNETGITKPANSSPISYVIGDPILEPDMIHEGFHLYWYKNLVDDAPNKEYVMYMTATFNNAANGRSPLMYTGKTPLGQFFNIDLNSVSGPNGKLFLKVILKYDETDKEYKYTFVPNSSQTGVRWDALSNPPTITFYQVAANLF